MSAKVIKLNQKAERNQLDEAAKALREGELVAFPTETVYGLGGNALIPETVQKIYAAKGRPSDNPLIVHIANKEDIYRLTKNVPQKAEKILDRLCPGPITVVLFKSDIVPDEVTAGGKTVAIRIPENEIARTLILKSGVPVAAPSANVSGRPSPTRAEHVLSDLGERIAYVIDGGACDVGLESTVIDFTVEPPRILRPGRVTHETLTALLGEVEGYAPKDADETAPKSPGMKYKHYAPNASLTVFDGVCCREEIKKAIAREHGKKIVVLTVGDAVYENACALSLGEDEKTYSANLFDALRRADEMKADLIFAELPFEKGGLATAIRNRIYKSAGGNVVLC